MAMAARNPAPPPPTSTTSKVGSKRPPKHGAPDFSLRPEQLLRQDPAVVVHDAARDAAVVVLVAGAHAATRVIDFLGEQGLIVPVLEVVGIDDAAAGRPLTGHVVASESHHSASLRNARPKTGRSHEPAG